MRRLLLIGIGAGDPQYVTQQAIAALNEVDVFFVMEKGACKDDLVALRREVCERYIAEQSYRIVAVGDPERDRGAEAYAAAVDDWRRARAAIWERLVADELAEHGVGAILVWGDPALYDSTLAIVETILAAGRVRFEVQVIPGISAIAALCARHAIALNRVGEAVHVTTGRRLAREGFPDNAPDVVVMLDAHCSFQGLLGRGLAMQAPTSARRTSSSWRGRSTRSATRSWRCAAPRASARAGSWTRTCCAAGAPRVPRRPWPERAQRRTPAANSARTSRSRYGPSVRMNVALRWPSLSPLTRTPPTTGGQVAGPQR